MNHQVNLSVPFEDNNDAIIAKTTLIQDPILKPQDIEIDYEIIENFLNVKFKSKTDRLLRLYVNNFMESLKTVIETIDEFKSWK